MARSDTSGRTVAVLSLLLTFGVLALSLGGAPASAAAGQLVPSATESLVDGSAVTLTAAGRKPRSSLQVFQCRGGDWPTGSSISAVVQVGDHPMERRNADCNPDLPNSKLDNSGRSVIGVTDTDGTLTIVTNVRSGTIASQRNDTNYVLVDVSFTCDSTSGCDLVAVDPANGKIQQSFPLTFAPDARAACGSATAATVTGSGPFSMSSTYQRWAAGSCKTGSDAPLLADYTDSGEYAGLSDFQDGGSDYAISATGFTTAGGSPVTGDRQAVFTPLAAQAAVIAFDGGYTVANADASQVGGVPIPELKMTPGEVATLFNAARSASTAANPELVARNPLLKRIQGVSDDGASLIKPDGALSTPDATTLAMTSAWAGLPASPWTHGILRSFPISLGTDGVGVVQIPLLSTLPALRTQVLGSKWAGSGVPANQMFLYLTDSATAANLGLRTVQIENASGAFVAPTAESIAAGISHMKANADGTLSADPTTVDPAAYPLPLVQYAVTPKQSFPDPARRDRLVQFLTYATTTGQSTDLAPGVFPLPAELKAQAATSLASIGSVAAPTPTPTTPTPTSTRPTPSVPLPATSRPVVALPGPGLPAANGLPVSAAAAPAGPAPTATPTPDAVAIPRFDPAKSSAASRLGPPIGVLGLALLLCGAAYATSGRPLPLPRLRRPPGGS